jgi:predicted nucleic-acid-binding protein
MTFVDTNYFLRYLLNDVAEQADEVEQLFRQAVSGEVVLCTSTIVLFEISWVLKAIYEQPKEQVIAALQKIVQLPFIQMKDKALYLRALNLYAGTHLSLEDCYNIVEALTLGCTVFGSFDKKAVTCFRSNC